MGATYQLPTEVKLEFDRDGTPHPFDVNAGFTQQITVQWTRSYMFYDTGHSAGLYIAWGPQSGTLQAANLMLGTDYDHTAETYSAKPSGNSGTLWLPEDLTPVTGDPSELDTTVISLFFCANGASGTSLAEFKCVPKPEQVQSQSIVEGLNVSVVIWEWEIRDDDPPATA